MRQEPQKTQYTKEYRTLLEKLLEIHSRVTEVKGDKKLQQKIEPIIDKLIDYFDFNITRTIKIQRKIQENIERKEYEEN